MEYRIEKDSLGERKIPSKVYYGIQTLRAMENFQITGIPISRYPWMIKSFACVKKAAAIANMELKVLDEKIGIPIIRACDDLRCGLYSDEFPIDVIQGGAGTSMNMNINEVLCNIALEKIGYKKGEYNKIHPIDHVNKSQSTNDTYPTSLHITLAKYSKQLISVLSDLRDSLLKKGEDFIDVAKIGRTQLQDAVPVTLGAEFTAYGVGIGEDIARLEEVISILCKVNLGATAIGTGINTVKGYSTLVCSLLADITNLPIVKAKNFIQATNDTSSYVTLSGILKRIAIKISKMCNDLRLLSSGPRAGLNEINLPPMQAGSSIMPGKVNPVIPEMVTQVCYAVIGADLTVTMASEGGQLELNAFEPIIAYKLFRSMESLLMSVSTLKTKCIDGITANKEHCLELLKNSLGVATVLNGVLGYEKAASVVKKALKEKKRPVDVLVEDNIMSEDEFERLLDIKNILASKD